MDPEKKAIPWFLRLWPIIIAILCVGPLALPLVWISPVFKRWQRWVITVLAILLTIWILKTSADLFATLLKEIRALQDVMK